MVGEGGFTKCLSFYSKDFYVLGKALTGELACMGTRKRKRILIM